MYGISRKIHERFINRKSKKHDEKYTVPFPTDIPNPNIVVFGTQGKELTTYGRLTRAEVLLAAKNISYIMETRYNKCEELVAIPDFLLLLDAVNGLVRTGETPSKEFREKYGKIVKEMLNDLIVTEEKIRGIYQ